MLNTTSCKKDDTLRYGNVTMGNLVDGKFISDQGNTFNMVEMNTTVDLKKFRRGIMQCDVLRETGEKEYDVRVTYMDTVFTKAPVLASIAAEDEEMMVEDPIYIDQRWISGGYLNMYIIFEIQVNPILKDSKHMINLVADDSAAETGKYTFTLRHNAFGETFKCRAGIRCMGEPPFHVSTGKVIIQFVRRMRKVSVIDTAVSSWSRTGRSFVRFYVFHCSM